MSGPPWVARDRAGGYLMRRHVYEVAYTWWKRSVTRRDTKSAAYFCVARAA